MSSASPLLAQVAAQESSRGAGRHPGRTRTSRVGRRRGAWPHRGCNADAEELLERKGPRWAWTRTTRCPSWRTWPTGTARVVARPACSRATPSCTRQRAQRGHVSRRIAPVWLAVGTPLFLVHLRDRSREQRVELERETALAELRATLEATADAILVTDLDGRIRAFNRRFAPMWSLPDAVLHAGDDRAVQEWVRMNVMDVDAYDRRLEEVYAHTLSEAVDRIAQVNGALIERHAQPQWSQGRPIGRVFSFRETNPHRAGSPREPGIGRRPAHAPAQSHRLPVDHRRTPCARAATAPASRCCASSSTATRCSARAATAPPARAACPSWRRTCAGRMRQPHHCARLGGSRFGVLIAHASEAAAEAAARRLIDSQEGSGGVPVAIGIGSYPGIGLSADEILRHVEIAMHRAQQASRSSFALHKFGFEGWQRKRDRVEAGLLRAAAEGPLPARRPAPLRHPHRPGRVRWKCICAGATANSARSPPASSWASPRSAAWSAPSTTGCSSTDCCCSAAGARPATRCA